MTKIIINEFYRGGNLITGDEFIELLLLEDLTATQLQSFFVGDSTASKASKSSAYQFTNMSTIATTFKAGTIIAVGGTGRIIQDTSYNPAGGDWNILLNAGNNSFLPNVGSSFGDLAADDIAWVDTSSTGATISADGFAVDIGTASGAFTSAVNVNFEASTNNTGYALNSDLAGATNTANWTTGIATASTTPGLPNGGANTTYIDSLRVTLPTVTIAATDANAAEAGLDPGTFRITRTGSTTNALAVSYTIGGQAANGTDYNPNLTGTATIAAGQSFVDITITPVNDSTAEGNETLTLDLVDTADYDLGATSKATVAIADNDTAGITITQSGDRTNVTEGGATDSYTVVLNTQPTAIVTININPDAQTTTNTNSLTFTPNNWNIAQNVTVTAVDDAAVEGNHTGTISHTATSIDNNYNGINIASLTANITDNDVAAPPTVNLSVSSNAGTEAGTTAITVTATAQSAVTGDQTVDLGVSGTNITPGDYNLSNTTITIPNGQTTGSVTFTVVDDAVVEGTETATLTITNPSAGITLGNTTSQNISISDNDTAGVTISQSGDSTDLTEGSATDSYTVVLNTQPAFDVIININSGSQTITNTTNLTFTNANWNTPQTVTITAVDDAVVEGNHTGTINHTATSIDNNYNGINIASVTANITDNDTAGVTLTKSDGNTNVTEGGATNYYTIVLNTQPTNDVNITIDSGTEATTNPTTLTFTTANWNTPQTVTITAVDDTAVEGNHTGTINHTATSSDNNYNEISITPFNINISDNDVATQPDLTISLSDSPDPVTVGNNLTYTFTVNNNGTANATGVDVDFTLPTGLSVVGTPGVFNSFTYSGTTGEVAKFTDGSINAGSNATLTLQVIPNSAGTLTSGSATVDPNNTITESNESNNNAGAVSTSVTIADNDTTPTPTPTPTPIPIPTPTPTPTPIPTPTPNSCDCEDLEKLVNNSYNGKIPDSNPPHDLMVGDANSDFFFGGIGNDSIFGGSGDDLIFGNQEQDFINGNKGNDTIFAGKDNDFVRGGQDNDLLFGDLGNDTTCGDRGNDSIFGMVGDDVLLGNQGDDFLNGNQGKDTVAGGEGKDIVRGGQDDDKLCGDAGNDTVFGDVGNDTICGCDGDDLIFGGAGNDTIGGGAGSDIFALTSGAGNDTFLDFAIAQDKLGLTSGLNFQSLTITQGTGTQVNDTLIRIVATGELLASLIGVSASSIASNMFTNV